MNKPRYCFDFFSMSGSRHEGDPAKNQDHIECRENEAGFAMVLADGVSSCRYAREGAECACQALANLLLDKGEQLLAYTGQEVAVAVVDYVLSRLAESAYRLDAPLEAFSSTVAGVYYHRRTHQILFVNLGDGMIAATTTGGDNIILSRPTDSTDGCFVTTTEHVETTVQVGIVDAKGTSNLYLLTDGAWRCLPNDSQMRIEWKSQAALWDFETIKDAILRCEHTDDASVAYMQIPSQSTGPHCRDIGRDTLHAGDAISLWTECDGEKVQRTFHIDRVVNAGSTMICYQAHHQKSASGVLREFYPRTAYSLERNKDGRLFHSSGYKSASGQFRVERDSYLGTIKALREQKQSDEQCDLSTFIPHFDIYYSTKSFEQGTFYVWSTEPILTTFEELSANRNYPELLRAILLAVEELTQCVCQLHMQGLVHRDIKPKNFGFTSRNGKIKVQDISLFDVDSICSAFAEPECAVISSGYTEPEALEQCATNQTDIYSIGATLCYGLLQQIPLPLPEYKDGWYLLLGECDLLDEYGNNPTCDRLKNVLSTILCGCLAPRRSRYQCCEYLLEDLADAIKCVNKLSADRAYEERFGDKE